MSDIPAAQGLTTDSLRRLLATLSRRPVFHHERDFQYELAWQARLQYPDVEIRPETRPLPGQRKHLDLIVTVAGRRAAIELKYLPPGAPGRR